jgi:hypothetical protein
LLLFAFVSTGYSPSNITNITSLIWFFAALVVAHDFFTNSSSKIFVIFAALTMAALSSKVSAGFTLLVAFSLTDFLLTVLSKSKGSLWRALILALGSVCSYFLVIGGPSRFGNDFLAPSLKNPAYFLGVEPDRSLIVFLIGTLGFLLSFAPTSLSLVINQREDFRVKSLVWICRSGFVSLVIASLMMEDNLSYFIISTKILAVIGSAVVLTSPTFTETFSALGLLQKRLVFLIAPLFAVSYQTVSEFDWREISTLRGGPIPISVLILVLYLLVGFIFSILFARYQTSTRNSLTRQNLIAISSFVLLFGALAPPAISHFRSIPSQANQSAEQPMFVGSIDLRDAYEWLSRNSSTDVIVATNRFCVEPSTPRCTFPKFYGVSANSRRKVLIEGPQALFGRTRDQLALPVEDESFYPEVGQERLNLSRGFADGPTAEIAARLRELGVDWFYLFLDNTENRNWAPYATVEYQNSEVAILKLTDPSS